MFSFVFGNSRWLWGRFCSNRRLETVLRCHIMAFKATGGDPAEVLHDRMRTAVDAEVEDRMSAAGFEITAEANEMQHWAPDLLKGMRELWMPAPGM